MSERLIQLKQKFSQDGTKTRSLLFLTLLVLLPVPVGVPLVLWLTKD